MNTKTLDFIKACQFDLQMGLEDGEELTSLPIPEGHPDLDDDVVYVAISIDSEGDEHYSYTSCRDNFSNWIVFGPEQAHCQYNYIDGIWVRKEFSKVYLFTAVEGEDSDG